MTQAPSLLELHSYLSELDAILVNNQKNEAERQKEIIEHRSRADFANLLINAGTPNKEANDLVSSLSKEELTRHIQNIPKSGCNIWRKVDNKGGYLPPWASAKITEAIENRTSQLRWVLLPNTYTHFNDFSDNDISRFIKEANDTKRASISNWRLPSLEEIKSFRLQPHKQFFGLPSSGHFWIASATASEIADSFDINNGLRSTTGKKHCCGAILVASK